MANVYSLASVVFTITNEALGRVSIGDATNNNSVGRQVTVSGAGAMLGSVSVVYDSDMFTKTATADGGVVFTHSNAMDGTITVSLSQTSPKIKDLRNFVLACRQDPANAASTITISDAAGNINVEARDCFPTKLPDNTLGATPADRDFTFICGYINANANNIAQRV